MQCRPCGISNEGSSQETDRYGDRAECEVSFDPNLRFSLWDDLDQLKETVNDFLNTQISSRFLTKNWNLSQDIQISKMLWTVYLLIVQNTLSTQKELTEQKCIRRNGMVEASGYKIDVRDTTGAGDSFIGAFLYCLLNDEVEDLESVSDDTLRNYLDFANSLCSEHNNKRRCISSHGRSS